MGCACNIKRPFQLAFNASLAASRVAFALVKGKPVFTMEDLARERLKICSNGLCPWYRERPTARCSHPSCGCFLKAKVLLTTETCPENRWREEPLTKP